MKNILRIEVIYNFLVQVDYLVSLCTAYLLGAQNWLLFFILLGLSLGLGFVTVYTYIRMMRKIVKTNNVQPLEG